MCQWRLLFSVNLREKEKACHLLFWFDVFNVKNWYRFVYIDQFVTLIYKNRENSIFKFKKYINYYLLLLFHERSFTIENWFNTLTSSSMKISMRVPRNFTRNYYLKSRRDKSAKRTHWPRFNSRFTILNRLICRLIKPTYFISMVRHMSSRYPCKFHPNIILRKPDRTGTFQRHC